MGRKGKSWGGGGLPFRSGLVHFLTRWVESLANFLRGWMMWAFTSDMVAKVVVVPVRREEGRWGRGVGGEESYERG